MRIPTTASAATSPDRDSIPVEPTLHFDESLSAVPQAPLCAMNGIPIEPEAAMVSTIYSFQTYDKSQLELWFKKKRTDPQTGAPLPETIYAYDEKGRPLRDSYGNPLVIKTVGPNPAADELREEFNKILDHLFRTEFISVPAFHQAIRTGKLEGIRYGARHLILADLKTGATALHIACEFGRATAVEHFLKNGTFKILDTRDKMRRTPLHMACLYDHINCVEILLKNEFKIIKVGIDAHDQYGNTSLHIAAMNGNLEILNLLINAGADINAVNRDGNTALHIAAYNCDVSIMERLVKEVKCDTHAINKAGQNPLHVACHHFTIGYEYNYYHRINKIGTKRDYLKSVNAIRFLLETKNSLIDITAKDRYGNLPLHDLVKLSSKNDYTALINIMLNIAGNEIAFRENNSGEIPLVVAAYDGNEAHFLRLFNLDQQKYPSEQLAKACFLAQDAGHPIITQHLFPLYMKDFRFTPSQVKGAMWSASARGTIQLAELLFKFENVNSS